MGLFSRIFKDMLKPAYVFVKSLFMVQAETHMCHQDGCDQDGLFRAPLDATLKTYVWLCKDHIVPYNTAWDYFDHMTPEQVARYQEEDMSGHRPTWPFGAHGKTRFHESHLRDPFGFHKYASTPQEAFVPREVREAAVNLDLDFPLSMVKTKKRYKELVKTCHPDLHQNSKKAEERFKRINHDYQVILKYLAVV